MSIFTKPPMFTRTTAPKLKTPHVSIEGKWRNIKKHVKGLERQGWQITSIDGGPDFQRTRVELTK